MGAAVLLMGAVAIISSSLLSGSIAQYDNLLEIQVAQERQVSALALSFKKQVQEWKNVLLLGSDNSARNKYWGRFKTLESDIQKDGKQLLSQLSPGVAKSKLAQFLTAHEQMAEG